MPKPTLKTPALIAQMTSLHSEGASAREIAVALGLNHGTILHWLRDIGLIPNGGQGPTKTRVHQPPGVVQAAAAEAHRALARLSVVPPTSDVSEPIAVLRHHQTIANRLVEYHFQKASEGATAVSEIAKAMQLEDQIAVRIQELTPIAPADPETDPGNLEAAAEVRARFARLVESAERGKR